MTRARVLFVCTHNSARSQMAEGLLRAHADDRFEAFSAGTEATAVRPEAIDAMAELGIDIASQESKSIDRYIGQPWDWVITVCDQARDACPYVPGARATLHWSVEDPSLVDADPQARQAAFRTARDDLADRVRRFVEETR
ncbi:MAG: arsenate reductase ArsC [Chloroflexota bacterium]|nr:arsenate reductase ArsC [Chloroflexota bacterium]